MFISLLACVCLCEGMGVRQVCASMWMLGIEPRTSRRSVNQCSKPLNHLSSPALVFANFVFCPGRWWDSTGLFTAYVVQSYMVTWNCSNKIKPLIEQLLSTLRITLNPWPSCLFPGLGLGTQGSKHSPNWTPFPAVSATILMASIGFFKGSRLVWNSNT